MLRGWFEIQLSLNQSLVRMTANDQMITISGPSGEPLLLDWENLDKFTALLQTMRAWQQK